jgi:hypothetical protein
MPGFLKMNSSEQKKRSKKLSTMQTLRLKACLRKKKKKSSASNLMSIITFIIILALLVLIHELGHYIFAKRANVKVDEFGIGYPPRAKTLVQTRGETTFTLNWIPFGGFVKIFGENPIDVDPEFSRSKTQLYVKTKTHPSRNFVCRNFVQLSARLAAPFCFNGIRCATRCFACKRQQRLKMSHSGCSTFLQNLQLKKRGLHQVM